MDGAFSVGGESVAADVGATFVHIGLILAFTLAGDRRDARGLFVKCTDLKRLKIL